MQKRYELITEKGKPTLVFDTHTGNSSQFWDEDKANLECCILNLSWLNEQHAAKEQRKGRAKTATHLNCDCDDCLGIPTSVSLHRQ